MGWESLFASLESEFAGAQAAELAADVEDRTRRERARVALTDRLRAAAGRQLLLALPGEQIVRGVVVDVGPDWLLLDEGAGRDALVALPAVQSVTGLDAAADLAGRASVVAERLGLRYALRLVARTREQVRLTTVDGSTVIGTVDAVGADWVEVTARSEATATTRTVPFVALAVVRSG
jgi:hypothetical protein